MPTGAGGGGGTGTGPLPHTHTATRTWHRLLRTAFVDVPEALNRSSQHRRNLERLIARHGGR